MTRGYSELEFDLPSALLSAILDRLETIEPGSLTAEAIADLPEEQGIYALYLKDPLRLVYVGKTDSDAGLKHRLMRHARKLVGRQNIGPGDVLFRAIRLFVFTAMDIESALIGHYGGVKAVPWNGSGFGSNDPGKERDTTTYKADHWDTQYPIMLDECYVEFEPGNYAVSDVMRNLKAGLPFLLRYERPGRARSSFHPDFEGSLVVLGRKRMTTRETLEAVMTALPTGWHVTAVPSHIIAYKDDRRRFPSGELLARS